MGRGRGYDPFAALNRRGAVAARLGLGKDALNSLIVSGVLRLARVGRQDYVVTASVERYLEGLVAERPVAVVKAGKGTRKAGVAAKLRLRIREMEMNLAGTVGGAHVSSVARQES